MTHRATVATLNCIPGGGGGGGAVHAGIIGFNLCEIYHSN